MEREYQKPEVEVVELITETITTLDGNESLEYDVPEGWG